MLFPEYTFQSKETRLTENGRCPEPNLCMVSLTSWIKAYIHPDQFDAFFNPKNASEKNAKTITPPSIGQLEKRTNSRATDVV